MTNPSYQVKIDAFEGPLDLLLHLINRYEIDIYDIPVSKITEQYVAYIHTMQKLELDVASEYLVMAATLLAMKSKMLLPKQEIEIEEDIYEEDPREELMRRLIEYRKYKQAADQLKSRELDKNQIYTRPPTPLDDFQNNAKSITEQGDVSVYDMLSAMQKLFQRKEWEKPLETRIQRQEIPIQERMEEILSHVRNAQSGVQFFDLFPYRSRSHIVVTFLAILELMKNRQVTCKQKNHFDNLIIFQVEV